MHKVVPLRGRVTFLGRLVLLGLAAVTADCSFGDPYTSQLGCPCDNHESKFEVSDDDGELGPLLAACEVSPPDCDELCARAQKTKARNLAGYLGDVLSCKLAPLDGLPSRDEATRTGTVYKRKIIAVYRMCYDCSD